MGTCGVAQNPQVHGEGTGKTHYRHEFHRYSMGVGWAMPTCFIPMCHPIHLASCPTAP